MFSFSRGVKVSTAVMIAAAGASSAQAGISYWDFNVFSRSTIGSQANPYGSDFEGASGAVGNAHFSGFTVRGVAGTSPSMSQGFYGGGNFTLSGSVAHGGLDVAGSVTMNGASVAGSVYAGGNLAGSGGSIAGNAILGGTKTAGQTLTVSGSLMQNQPYSPTIDLAAVSQYFLSVSNAAAAMSATTNYASQYGKITVNASGPLTVVNMTLADFTSAWGIEIIGGGQVVINLDGTSVSFASKTWMYSSGASATNTLLNLNKATTFALSGGNTVNILAPNADTTFSSGVVTGNLIVGSLMGSGQVNWGGTPFDNNFQVPTPGVAALLGLGALAAGRRRRVTG